MFREATPWLARLAVIGLGLGAPGHGQNGVVTDHYAGAGLGSLRYESFRKIGDRLSKPGKERVVYLAQFEDDKGQRSQAMVTWEVPGRIRFDESGPRQRTLAFNGTDSFKGAGGAV